MSQELSLPNYVLVTPARNEAHYILGALRSVLSQTWRPLRWVVVSDGSTDGTDDLVRAVATQHPWVELLRMPEHEDRHFASKARCFQAGYERLKSLNFDVVGNLDADITFAPPYLEFLLRQFALNPHLGVAGTPYVEDARYPHRHAYAHPSADLRHVSGACQLFRRVCFDDMGGYPALKGGTVDWTAVTQARMNGWETRTFTEMTCLHHRPVGTAMRSRTGARFDQGGKAYRVGGHPAWELLRGMWLMRQPPYIVGGCAFLAGFVIPYFKREARTATPAMQAFHRAEQLERLRQMWRARTRPRTQVSSQRLPQSAKTAGASDPWTEVEVSIKGKSHQRVALRVEGHPWVAHGLWWRHAEIWDEAWTPGEWVTQPERVRQAFQAHTGFADLFSFPCVASYRPSPDATEDAGLGVSAIRWSNKAVLPTADPQAWWTGLSQETRKNVRRAERRGVQVKELTWSQDLARGIQRIYDESPLRQGRPFWHYGKSLDQVVRDNATYLERSTFLGAFVGEEMVAFIKWVRVNDEARIMQILALQSHQDKRPLMALIAHAVWVCHRQGVTGLIYGKMTYGSKTDSSMVEFKRRLGFQQVDMPRLVVAVTTKGRWVVRWGLDRPWSDRLPSSWVHRLLKWRTWWLSRHVSTKTSPAHLVQVATGTTVSPSQAGVAQR